MSNDPAVQAAIEAARAMQRRWHSDDTEAVCRAAVEAARPIIEAEALKRFDSENVIQAILDGRATTLEDALGRAAVRTEPEQQYPCDHPLHDEEACMEGTEPER